MGHEKATPKGELGERLFKAMNAKFPSQNQLQKAAGVAQSAITKLITGKVGEKVSAKTIFDLADALDVNAEWLLRGTGPERGEGVPRTPHQKAEAIAKIAGFTPHAIKAGLAHYTEHDSVDVIRLVHAIEVEAHKEAHISALAHESRRKERARFKGKKAKETPATTPKTQRKIKTGT